MTGSSRWSCWNAVSPRMTSWTTVSPVVGHAQAVGARALVGAAVALLGAVLGLPRLDVVAGGVRAVDLPALDELVEDLLVAVGARDLRDRVAVPVEPEPAQRLVDVLDVLGRVALGVGVLDAQEHLAAVVAGLEPVEQRGAGAADVQLAGRGGSESDAHRVIVGACSSVPTSRPPAEWPRRSNEGSTAAATPSRSSTRTRARGSRASTRPRRSRRSTPRSTGREVDAL